MKFVGIVLVVFVWNIEISEESAIDKRISVCDRDLSSNSTFYRLPKTVKPIKYKIRFRADHTQLKFYGTERILIMINNRTNIIELNSVDLVIESAWFQTRRIRVDAKSSCTCPEKETVVLQFPKFLEKGKGNLTINFRGNVNNMVTGFYRTNYKSQTELDNLIAITDFGPTDARRAFPSWDEPALKARFELTLIAPKDHFTLTNMNEVNRRYFTEQLEEIKFALSPPMSTYVMSVVVGQFDFIESITEDKEVMIRVFTPIGRKEEGMFALDLTARLLLFYKYYFNITYPLLKLDLISIPDFPSAMENWGLITFTETQILVNDQTSEEDKRIVAVVIAHGLAHQWFGNLVTLNSWNELWLNEGFSTFMENQAIDIIHPNWKVWNQFVSNDYQNALESDALKTSRSIETNADIPSHFDDRSYQKTASIIRMLNDWIGEEPFRNGIRNFLSKYSYLSASAKDFWEAFDSETDLNTSEIMDTWTKQKGFPVINVNERQDGENRILILTQEKYSANGKLDKEEKSQLWHIPIKVTNLFSPYTSSAQIIMRTKQIELTVEGVWEGEWVKINPNSNGFYHVNYPINMINKFISSVEDKTMPPLDRLNLLSDIFAAIQSGRISTEVGFAFLMAMKNEDDYAVWNYILKLVSKLDLLLSDTDLREKFWLYGQQLLSNIFVKLGWDKHNNEDLLDTKLRPKIIALLGTFGDKNIISEALKRFNEYVGENSHFSNDILIAIYKIVGANSDNEMFNEFFEMYKSAETAQKRNLIAVALSSTHKKEQILKVLEFSLSDEIRHIDSSTIISRLGHSMIGRDKTWKFFQIYFEEFKRRFGSSTRGMNEIIKNFVQKFSSEDKANEFEEYFKINKTPGLQKSIEESIEKIRVNAKWLNRDILKIREYFTKNT